MRKLKFPNKPVIIPIIRQLYPKSFRQIIDEAILEHIKKKAKKEIINEKETKSFLEKASTKFGEDDE